MDIRFGHLLVTLRLVCLHSIRPHHKLQRGKLPQAPSPFEIKLNLVFAGPHRQKSQDAVHDLQTQGGKFHLSREFTQVEHT